MLAKKMEMDEIKGAQEEQAVEEKKLSLSQDKIEKTAKKTMTKVEDLAGVGAATAEKLRASGYDTLLSIAVSTPGELVEVSGVTETTARKMINASRDAMEMGFESGFDVLKKRERVTHITTGSDNFDKMMNGGFETGAIVECFGQYGSGKTQVGHQLAVNVQRYGEDVVAVYVDTENTFRPERVIQFAKGLNLDPDKVLKNIKVARAYNSDHQMLLAEKIEDLITHQKLNVKLVVIDSLTAHFRAEFVGRGTLADRQQKLNKHMHVLARLADTHNLCVYVTNQVMAKPDQFFGDPTEAIGGHIVGHNSTYRIYLRKGKKGSRVAKLVDAPDLPDGEAMYWVTDMGIRDTN